MSDPVDTAQIREDVAGEFLAGVVYRLCDEVDRLRTELAKANVTIVRMSNLLGETLGRARAAHEILEQVPMLRKEESS